MKAAFFDLDRTLVRVNTAPLYARWRVREKQLGWFDMVRVGWWGLQYKFGVLDVGAATARALTTLEGRDEAAFRRDCAAWAAEEVFPHLTDRARAEVEARRREGFMLALLTTTTRYVADPVAREVGVEHVLCSEVEVQRGRFTGQLSSPLCYGEGKVDQARRFAEDHDIDLRKSVFYTDSVSDLPMLEEVGEPRVINPDPRLKRLARTRGWPVEQWV